MGGGGESARGVGVMGTCACRRALLGGEKGILWGVYGAGG